MGVVLPEFVEQSFKNEWRDIPEDDYHKDLTAVARGDILAFMRSGRAFLARRAREQKDDVSDAIRIGRAAHILALEPQKFARTYVVMPEFVGKTKDGKDSTRSKEAIEKREAWIADQPPGAEFVSAEELSNIRGMCDAVLLHPRARGMFEGGILEQVGYYRDPVTGLKCRVKPDCIATDINGLFDFKTTRDASYRRFASSIWDNRYDIQLAMYAEGAGQILGKKPDILGWVCVEKEPPYEVGVYIADIAMMELAEKHYRTALDGLAEAVKTGNFTFRQQEAQTISLPNYAFYEEAL